MIEEMEVGADGDTKTRNGCCLPLALPFTLEEAKIIMRLTKWDDVFWVGSWPPRFSSRPLPIDMPLQEARLRDILVVPEAQWNDVVPCTLCAPGTPIEG